MSFSLQLYLKSPVFFKKKKLTPKYDGFNMHTINIGQVTEWIVIYQVA